jgi:hypothetical protein
MNNVLALPEHQKASAANQSSFLWVLVCIILVQRPGMVLIRLSRAFVVLLSLRGC